MRAMTSHWARIAAITVAMLGLSACNLDSPDAAKNRIHVETPFHPMPQLQWWQRVLTEDEQRRPGSPGAPSVASTEDLFEKLARAAAAGDDKAFRAAAQSHLESAEGQALMAAGRQANEAREFQRQQELASVQPTEQAVPQMRVRS